MLDDSVRRVAKLLITHTVEVLPNSDLAPLNWAKPNDDSGHRDAKRTETNDVSIRRWPRPP